MTHGRSSGRIADVIMRLDDLALNITLVVCGGLLLAMVIIEALGVVFRFILHDSLSWSDELASYLFVWLTCLGAAAGIKLRVHPEVKALADRLPAITQPWLEVLTDVAIAALGMVFVIYGSEMLMLMGSETASSLPISMVYPYLAIPVGGMLLMLHAFARILVSFLSPGEMQSLVAAPEIAKHI
jgi:TRAP-type C4-dicarboxylate transport system permease small subunit